jgi:hypothetical protein
MSRSSSSHVSSKGEVVVGVEGEIAAKKGEEGGRGGR